MGDSGEDRGMSFVGTRVEDCELPKTWGIGRLDEVCHQMKQGKIRPRKEIHETGSYPVFGANGCIGYSEEYFLEEQRVLITCRGSTCGVVNKSPKKSFVTNNAMILFEKDCLDNDFLFFVLKEFSTKRLKTGSGQPQLTKGILNSHAIPLPPLPEQKKIAHVLSKVQRAIEAQERIIKTTTDLFKSTLYQLMTGQSRADIPGHEKSGQDLKGYSVEGRGKNMVRDIEFTQIAADWGSITLGEEDPQALLVMRNGLTAKQVQGNGQYKVSRIETIRAGWIDDTRVRFVSGLEDKYIKKYLLQKGDILFSHINSDRHLGKTGFADRDYDDLLHGMNLLLIRANPKVFDPEFLNHVFQYYRDIGVFMAICSRAVNQSSINQARMKALELPFPPLAEQKEIVHILSFIQQKTDNAQTKKRKLQDLFRTLLHELMTAKIRVY